MLKTHTRVHKRTLKRVHTHALRRPLQMSHYLSLGVLACPSKNTLPHGLDKPGDFYPLCWWRRSRKSTVLQSLRAAYHPRASAALYKPQLLYDIHTHTGTPTDYTLSTHTHTQVCFTILERTDNSLPFKIMFSLTPNLNPQCHCNPKTF